MTVLGVVLACILSIAKPDGCVCAQERVEMIERQIQFTGDWTLSLRNWQGVNFQGKIYIWTD